MPDHPGSTTIDSRLFVHARPPIVSHWRIYHRDKKKLQFCRSVDVQFFGLQTSLCLLCLRCFYLKLRSYFGVLLALSSASTLSPSILLLISFQGSNASTSSCKYGQILFDFIPLPWNIIFPHSLLIMHFRHQLTSETWLVFHTSLSQQLKRVTHCQTVLISTVCSPYTLSNGNSK